VNESAVHYRFGRFQFILPQLTLTRDGEPVKLGGRALNLLAVLAEANGSLVTRSSLLESVWPGQAIDESAIRVHLSAVRKALAEGGAGESAIVNEAGRGYRLALPVVREAHGRVDEEPIASTGAAVATPLPVRLGSVWGRDAIVAALAEELGRRRFITIAGPGGIGKTTAALQIAALVSRDAGSTACFVDLAPVDDSANVEAVVASALGLPPSGGDLLDRISASGSAMPTLLLFDNCEQVVDAAAGVVEDLLRTIPSLSVLATSREPLRAEGEWVHRLAALDFPAVEDELDLDAERTYPAVALFGERARAVNGAFRLGPDTMPAVIEICRKLDGMPLAIEFAAARCDLMYPRLIAAGLDDRFGLLTRGRRTALPRHKTLRAVLDWSYMLLEPTAQRLLDRLSLFRSGFDADAAMATAVGAGLSPSAARDALADLVAKSLVGGVTSSRSVRFRLLDTTRHYGLERLDERGEGAEARRVHADHLLSVFENSAAAWEGKAPREWLTAYIGHIEDVRGSLLWANGEGSAPALAVELLIASAALWFHLSLPREFLVHAETAIAAMDGGAVNGGLQIELLSAYGHALWHTRGPVPEMRDAFVRAMALAEANGSDALALRALWGVWAYHILAGEYPDSLTLARRFADAVGPEGDLAGRQTGAHMLALSYHFAGDHDAAASYLDDVLAGDDVPERANHANHAQVDGKIAAMSLMMRLRWLHEGDIAGALELACACADDAVQIDHALSSCYGLAIGCIPVAIVAGKTALAREWIAVLADHTGRHGLDHWATFVAGYRHALDDHEVLAEGTRMQREMFEVAADGFAEVAWNLAVKASA
jgi:predicted ATPase/DNA-binding winged helix-turn-helix (wHTH) protein